MELRKVSLLKLLRIGIIAVGVLIPSAVCFGAGTDATTGTTSTGGAPKPPGASQPSLPAKPGSAQPPKGISNSNISPRAPTPAEQMGLSQDDVAPWADSNKYQACGQECIQTHANETLSLDFTYTLMKIREIHTELNVDPNSQKVKDSLGNFCSKGEGVNDCAKRYVAYQLKHLIEIRNAIGNNETTIKSLANVSGTSVNRPAAVNSGKMAQVTFVPNLDKIKNAAKKTKATWSDHPELYGKAAQYPVDCENIVVYKEELRNKGEGGSGMISVVDDSPKAKSDAKLLCLRAKKNWEDLQIKGTMTGSEDSKEYDPASQGGTLPSVDEAAWQKSRRVMMGYMNENLKELDLIQKPSKDKKKTGDVQSNTSSSGAKDQNSQKNVQTGQQAAPDTNLYNFKYSDRAELDADAALPSAAESTKTGSLRFTPGDMDNVLMGNQNDPGYTGVVENLGDEGKLNEARQGGSKGPAAGAAPGAPAGRAAAKK